MIEVHKDLKARYDDMTVDYAIKDWKELIEKIIIYSLDDGKSLKAMPALAYFKWVCENKDVTPHRVFGVDDYEKYRELFEKAEEE